MALSRQSVLSRKIVERFLSLSRLSPPGDRWCGVRLGFVPTGSVYASLLQAIDGVMSGLGFVPAGSVYASLLQVIDGVVSGLGPCARR